MARRHGEEEEAEPFARGGESLAPEAAPVRFPFSEAQVLAVEQALDEASDAGWLDAPVPVAVVRKWLETARSVVGTATSLDDLDALGDAVLASMVSWLEDVIAAAGEVGLAAETQALLERLDILAPSAWEEAPRGEDWRGGRH